MRMQCRIVDATGHAEPSSQARPLLGRLEETLFAEDLARIFMDKGHQDTVGLA